MQTDLLQLYRFAGNRLQQVAKAAGVSRGTIWRWVRGDFAPSKTHAKAFTSACFAVGLEARAKEAGLSGGHELLGTRRDVFRRYLNGRRRMAIDRAARVAFSFDLPTPGYGDLSEEMRAEPIEFPRVELERGRRVHFIIPYAEYVEWRASGLVQEPAGMGPAITRARRAYRSNFMLMVDGILVGNILKVEDYGIEPVRE